MKIRKSSMTPKQQDDLLLELYHNFKSGNRTDVFNSIMKLNKKDAVLMTLRFACELGLSDRISFLSLIQARV